MEQNKFDWDLTKFCKDINDCENKLKQVDVKLEELVKYKGKLNTPSSLLEFWEKEQETENIFEDCYIYALASKDKEETSQSFQQLSQKVMNMGSKISSELAFVYPEFKHLGNDYLRSLLKDKNFENWKLEIEKIIDENEHTLSEAEEQILAQVESFTVGFKNIYSSCFFGDVKYQDATDENGVIAHYKLDDLSGLTAGTNADITSVDGRNALQLNGKESYVTSPIVTAGLGNDLRVKVKRTSSSSDEQILFESDYGSIKAIQKDTHRHFLLVKYLFILRHFLFFDSDRDVRAGRGSFDHQINIIFNRRNRNFWHDGSLPFAPFPIKINFIIRFNFRQYHQTKQQHPYGAVKII